MLNRLFVCLIIFHTILAICVTSVIFTCCPYQLGSNNNPTNRVFSQIPFLKRAQLDLSARSHDLFGSGLLNACQQLEILRFWLDDDDVISESFSFDKPVINR
jgi:hypothetical protein